MRRFNYFWFAVLSTGMIGALFFLVACENGGESVVGPDLSVSQPVVQQSTPEVVAPEQPAEEPEDASDGRGLTASFDGLDATIKSTNLHPNHGLVCYTNEFMGSGLPGTPVKWNTEPKGSTTVKFPKDEVAAGLEWKAGQCEQSIRVQGDVYRGDRCRGHILAVAWPKDNKVTFTRPTSYGEWSEWTATGSVGEWSECQADPTSGNPTTGNVCEGYRTRTVEEARSRKNLCSDEMEVETRTVTETGRCELECPCIETGPVDLPGDPVWFEEILRGQCEQEEVLPLPQIAFDEQTVRPLNCHQLGEQPITIDYVCEADQSRTRNLCRNVECPCKEWYPGTPPAENARITFMSKTPDNKYLWRLQNGTGNNELVVKGGGFPETVFEVPAGTVSAFTTTNPYGGLSVYACDGSRLHGTASSNETVENWCSYPSAPETECPCRDYTTSIDWTFKNTYHAGGDFYAVVGGETTIDLGFVDGASTAKFTTHSGAEVKVYRKRSGRDEFITKKTPECENPFQELWTGELTYVCNSECK